MNTTWRFALRTNTPNNVSRKLNTAPAYSFHSCWSSQVFKKTCLHTSSQWSHWLPPAAASSAFWSLPERPVWRPFALLVLSHFTWLQKNWCFQCWGKSYSPLLHERMSILASFTHRFGFIKKKKGWVLSSVSPGQQGLQVHRFFTSELNTLLSFRAGSFIYRSLALSKN